MGKPFAFSKNNRLAQKQSFKRVFAFGFFVKTSSLAVYAIENDISIPRLGVIAAKRRFKRAVVRNRLRRLIRESFRKAQKDFSGWDVVVIIRKNIDELEDQKQRAQQLQQAWKRLVRKKC